MMMMMRCTCAGTNIGTQLSISAVVLYSVLREHSLQRVCRAACTSHIVTKLLCVSQMLCALVVAAAARLPVRRTSDVTSEKAWGFF